jgi:antitoxin component of RelBE/YafQ-DinJ toxin-antitoxin module
MSERKQVHIRVPSLTLDQLSSRAKTLGLSQSQLINLYLVRGLEKNTET